VKRHLPHLLLMAAIVLLDQGTKALVVRSLPLHGYVPLVDGLLSLSHVRNRGAAFGILSDWDLPYQTLLLSALSLGALLAIAYYFVRLPAAARLPRVALALVLGGAVGNLLDRLRLGYVVDFVHVYWRDHQWPDFNVADSAITVGVTLLVLDILRSPGPGSTRPRPRPGGSTDMHPRLLTIPAIELLGRSIGPFTLHTYGVLLALAFLVGLWVISRQAKRAGLDANRITDMAVWVLIAGLVGAKLLLVAVDWRYFGRNPREIGSILQSGGVYGGLIGGILVAWWYVRRNHLPGWQTADVLVPGVALGQAIGRLGCFAAGCCWGRTTQVPWAVTFTDVYSARAVGTPMDTPVHPSQLYESFATFLIFLVLLWLAPRKRFQGQVALVYVALYSAVRFGLEFLRGDPDRGAWFGGTVSTSQLIAIALLLGVAVLLPRVRKTQAITPA
jgi:phosphatidylglycerol:prolipoprotein diacylglycerol transferase